MIPRSILDNLAALRSRERLVAFVWGAARWTALVVGVLLIACLVDWFIDRTQDTPLGLRRFMTFFQIFLAVGLAMFFIVMPLLRRRTDADLALEVEKRHPKLSNRLISSVQLNTPGARKEGMSQELIDVVTQEADKQTRALRFSEVADGRPLGWSLVILLPVLILALVPLVLFSDIAGTLLARQFLSDREIPRRTHLEPDVRAVYPIGEDAVLKFKVKGKNLDGDNTGIVLITPSDKQRRQLSFELEHVQALGEDEALFQVKVPAASVSSSDFAFSARLRDGRMRTPGQVKYVPRPIVQETTALVLLPEFCGTQPDGKRFAQIQARGDLAGIPGSSGVVVVKTQKKVQHARLKLLGYEHPIKKDKDKEEDPGAVPAPLPPEVVKRELKLDLSKDGMIAATEPFDLKDDEHAYTIEVADEYGFTNDPRPRRKVSLIPEDPPVVTLLKEQFPPEEGAVLGPLDDYEVSGMPAVLGKKARLAYTASGPYGLGRAVLLYRVLRKSESGNEDPGQEEWTRLALVEQLASKDTGAFDPRRGCFQNSPLRAVVPFHAVLSDDPNKLSRTLGGGRYDLETAGLVDSKGMLIKLKKGDQIEYCVEVYADKNPAANRPMARSETRVTTVVDPAEFHQWILATLREEEQIRQLDSKQRGLFGEK